MHRKMYALFCFVIVGIIVIIFVKQDNEKNLVDNEPSMSNVNVLPMKADAVTEIKNNVSIDSQDPIDTAIDPSIQPIPPEQDPSNTVKY